MQHLGPNVQFIRHENMQVIQEELGGRQLQINIKNKITNIIDS